MAESCATQYTSIAGPTQALPDVLGLSRSEAAARLTAAGFTMTSVDVTVIGPAGQVVAESPAPGLFLAKGTIVTIRVSNGQRSH